MSVPPPLPKTFNSQKRTANLSNQADSQAPTKKRKSRFDQAPPGLNENKSNNTSNLEEALKLAKRFTTTTTTGISNFEAQVPIPPELMKDKSLNFVGLLIGPGGQTQKRLQRDLQAKINIQCPGVAKVSKNTTEGLYVAISSTSQTKLDVAVAYITGLIHDPEQRDALKRDQSSHIQIPNFFPVSTNANISTASYPVEVLSIPADKVGIIIGKNGETIQEIQAVSGARMVVETEHNPDHPNTRDVTIQGTLEQVEYGKSLIRKYTSDRTTRPDGSIEYDDQYLIPQNLVGIVIGKGGETIRNLQQLTNCNIQVITSGSMSDSVSGQRIVKLKGTMEELNSAKQQISLLIDKYKQAPLINTPIGNDIEIVAIPLNCVGALLGKGGESVKNLAFHTGTRIQVINEEDPNDPNFDSKEFKKVSIRGNQKCIQNAKVEIQKLIDSTANMSLYAQTHSLKPHAGDIINPYTATSAEEGQQFMQQYMQQIKNFPSWNYGGNAYNQASYAQYFNNMQYANNMQMPLGQGNMVNGQNVMNANAVMNMNQTNTVNGNNMNANANVEKENNKEEYSTGTKSEMSKSEEIKSDEVKNDQKESSNSETKKEDVENIKEERSKQVDL